MSASAVPNEKREREMAEQRSDVVVIGAGHNGLIAGAYLARAGLG